MAIEIHDPQGRLVRLDERRCVLNAFTDDRGVDLLGKPGRAGLAGPPHPVDRTSVSKDRRTCMVEIFGQGVPSADATSVRLSVQFGLLIAPRLRDVEVRAVSLAEGAVVKAGQSVFKVTRESVDRGDRKSTVVTFTNVTGLERVSRIRFRDTRGRAIRSVWSGWPRISGNTCIAVLAKEAGIVDMVVTVWDEARQVTLTADCSAGLGLSP